MSVELGAPCQSKLGSMIQSRIGSALACARSVFLFAIIDESSIYRSFQQWLDDVAIYESALQELTARDVDVRSLVIHVPDRFHPSTGDPVYEAITVSIGSIPADMPDTIEVVRAADRPPSADFMLSKIGEPENDFYVRLAHDASGSMSVELDEPEGFRAEWESFVLRASQLPAWSGLSEGDGTLDVSKISPIENVLVNFANAMADALALVSA